MSGYVYGGTGRDTLAPPPDPREYMTPDEFAALGSDAQITVWQAHARNLVDTVPASAAPTGSTLRYHRAQVLAIIGETVAAR